MINSKGSAVRGDERAEGKLTAPLVVSDHCGEGEYALEHPGGDPGEGAAAMALEIELALQGLIGRLDDLTEGLQELSARPRRFADHLWADEGGSFACEEGIEPLVSHDRLAQATSHHAGSISSRSRTTSRSSAFGLARA